MENKEGDFLILRQVQSNYARSKGFYNIADMYKTDKDQLIIHINNIMIDYANMKLKEAADNIEDGAGFTSLAAWKQTKQDILSLREEHNNNSYSW